MQALKLKRFAALGVATVLATSLSVLSVAAPALASGPSPGTQVPNSAVPMGSTLGAPEFYDGQKIVVTIPPNSHFKPGVYVNILECADRGGSPSNLPINADTCDGNTIQGSTVLAQKDGSMEYKGYVIYSLPNVEQLGEPKDSQPVCNTTHECVLYIGQNQEAFTAPHYWSQPFFVAPTEDAVTMHASAGGGTSVVLIVVIVVVVLAAIGLTIGLLRRRSSRTRSRRGRR
jgi:hypothetical protein